MLKTAGFVETAKSVETAEYAEPAELGEATESVLSFHLCVQFSIDLKQ